MRSTTGYTARELADAYLQEGQLPPLPSGHFICGEVCRPQSGNYMASWDPGLGRAFADFAAGDADDIERAVQAANRAQNPWGSTAPSVRADLLQRVSARILEQQELLIFAEALDSGKTLGEARGDVLSAARYFNYYAALSRTLEGRSLPLGESHIGWTVREPIGVTAHIIPWNFPTSTFARSVAPALAAGCTVVAKPAETTPITALLLAQIISECGVPAGVVNVVTGLGTEAGAALSGHRMVRHITFTGSVPTGVKVAGAAAKNIASLTLELGGKSPLVALSDCDIEAAAEGARWAIFANAGQICSAGSRLVVQRSVYEPILDRLLSKVQTLRIGHGLGGADVGAVNSDLQLSRIDAHVEGARQRGRRIVCGGKALNGPGWFYPPTIIDSLPMEDACIQQEIFGPVLAIQIVDNDEEALNAANCTDFGLYAGVYSRDISRALRMAQGIRAGQVTINDYWAGGVSVPFGGKGHSGYGREKGQEGMEAYLSSKAVVVRV
jgi:aldehyde dehydrogenase (NAD+)/betaine-aldehyde dehydrogenase